MSIQTTIAITAIESYVVGFVAGFWWRGTIREAVAPDAHDGDRGP